MKLLLINPNISESVSERVDAEVKRLLDEAYAQAMRTVEEHRALLTSIADDTDRPEATEMIRRLVKAHETVARTARAVYPAVEKAHDEPTADLLTQCLQVHEKTAWMLRSLLE